MDPILRPNVQRNVITPLNSNFNPLPLSICSPVNVDVLSELLCYHPDRVFVEFLLSGFTYGFSIGYEGPLTCGQSVNLLSARSNPAPVEKAIITELQRGHTSGPFDLPPFANLHCSPLGAVPKKDGTYRIILDLSSPRGSSINEYISKERYSVRYSTFDDAVALVSALGPSAYMAKLDVKHAFRLCPVREADWVHLGYCWNGQYFIDTRLPFGSRSSPFIFNSFADALLWILTVSFSIPFIVHYLDDYFLCSFSHQSCKEDMQLVQSVFSRLGVPLAPGKIIGPCTSITYLGIEIDSVAQAIRLPPDKFSELLSLLRSWEAKKKCTKRELLSLIGSLSFACKVVKPGRIFLRRLIDLSTSVQSLNHHIYLNYEARADIAWWIDFLPTWNGVELIQAPVITSVSLTLFTDASSIGCGGVYNTKWFSARWPSQFLEYHINFLELFAIWVAVFIWGSEWKNKQILFYTDNMPITNIWKNGSCVNKDIMRLVRILFLFCAKSNINLLMQHIPGHYNKLADALSRCQVAKFHACNPAAAPEPTAISVDVWHV